MLELIHDNRNGRRMEIVIPTFNEAARAERIVSHYASRFDVVVLDDDSADSTVALAIAAGGTVFRRTVKDIAPEAHLTHYVNELTRSGLCFWMLADEFAPLHRMKQIEDALREGASSVLCRRVNYFFAREILTLTSVHPRGFIRGAARFESNNLHGSLCLASVPGRQAAPTVFEIHHLHIGSTRSYFGTAGSYASTEVEQFLQSRRPHWRFMRRYVFSLGAYMVLKWWREKNLGCAARLVIAMERLVILLLGAMSWIEQKHLPTVAQQKVVYEQFFLDDNDLLPSQLRETQAKRQAST